jgi:hypothetical protein
MYQQNITKYHIIIPLEIHLIYLLWYKKIKNVKYYHK